MQANRNITQFEITEKIRNMIRGKISPFGEDIMVSFRIDDIIITLTYDNRILLEVPENYLANENIKFMKNILSGIGYKKNGYLFLEDNKMAIEFIKEERKNDNN